MALSQEHTPKSSVTHSKKGPANVSIWPTLIFLAGLVSVYLGQRVVITPAWASLGLTLAGGIMTLTSTLVRGGRLSTPGGGLESANGILAKLQALGLLGLALYVGSTDWGLALLNLEAPQDEASVQVIFQVLWTITLCVAATALGFAELALQPMRRAAHIETRRVRAAAASGAILALAASYSSLFVFAASRAETQADYSYFKTSEPGEATLKLVQKMGDAVKVTAFFPEVSGVRKEVMHYFNKLRQDGGQIDFTVADRYLNPKLAQELKVTQDGVLVIASGEATRTLSIGDDLKRARTRLKTLDREFHAELLKLLRSARVAYLTVGHGELNEKQNANKERSVSLLQKLLKQQNYQVKELGLAQGLAGRVPEDAALVMVLGPTLPFAPAEIETLKAYADAGGKLMMALDSDGVSRGDFVALDRDVEPAPESPAQHIMAGGGALPNPTASAQPIGQALAKKDQNASPAAPAPSAGDNPEPATQESPVVSGEHASLRALAAVAGVQYEPTPLADAKQYIPRRRNPSDYGNLFSNRFSSHASVSTLSRNSTRAAVVFSGTGSFAKDGTGGSKVDAVIRSFSSAFADANRNFTRDDSEKSTSFGLGVAVTREATAVDSQTAKAALAKVAEDSKDEAAKDEIPSAKDEAAANKEETGPSELRAFLLADVDVFTDLFMSNFPSNQMLFFDAVRWLGGEESLAGELESEEDVRIEHTKQKDLAWFYSTIFGVPLAVLALGLVLSRRLKGVAA